MIVSPNTLHVHCGDTSANALRASGVPGDITVWCDPLAYRPTPAQATPEEWAAHFADYAADFLGSRERALETAASMDRPLESCGAYDEVVLWFDACLFDTIILVRQLDWFAARRPDIPELTLIYTGEFPGHPRFAGLGELAPDELASLLDQRRTVTREQYLIASEAWNAYRSPDPRSVAALCLADTSSLPHLAPAFARHLQRFPSTVNGLSRLEQTCLELVGEGMAKVGPVFAAAGDRDRPPFFGDTYIYDLLRNLASCPNPLLELGGSRSEPNAWRMRLTAAGMAVIRAQYDHVALNGIDRWLGGVHLTPDNLWRRDRVGGRLIGPA